MPWRCAKLRHNVANCPVSKASTLSPGDSVLRIAASQAPVPDDGKIATGPEHLKTRFKPVMTALLMAGNSGPRWSMSGWSIARRTRSGRLVGPGIFKRGRPLRNAMTNAPPSKEARNLPGFARQPQGPVAARLPCTAAQRAAAPTLPGRRPLLEHRDFWIEPERPHRRAEDQQARSDDERRHPRAELDQDAEDQRRQRATD